MLTPRRHLSIDIGSRNVKLVELVKERSGYKLLRARIVPIYYEPQSGYIPQYDEALRQALVTVMPRAGKGTLSLVISGQSVFLRFVRLPKTSHGRVDQIVHYEAEQQVPFPLDEVVWDYQIIRESEGGEEVVLVAVKKELISSLLSDLDKDSVMMNLVDSAPLALYNALFLGGDFQDQVILDIGAKTTNLLIPDQGRLWARTIMIAGDDITKAIASGLNISFQEAEELKIKHGINPDTVASLPEIIGGVLTDLLTEISSSVGYYKSQLGQEKAFKGIRLTGGSANLKNLTNFIGDNLGIPAGKIDFFAKIRPATHLRLNEEDRNLYGASLGAALRQLQPVLLRTNLLPAKEIEAARVRRRKPYLLAISLFLTLSLLGLNGIAHQSIIGHRQNITALETLVAEFESYQDQVNAVNQEINAMQEKLDLLNEMASAKTFWLKILLEMARSVSDDIWLVGLDKDEEGLTIKGETQAPFTRITDLKRRLTESRYFEEVKILKADLVGANLKAFEIKMKLSKEALE